MVKLSDGTEVPLADLEQNWSKNRNADERLAEANRIHESVKAAEARINEQFPAQKQDKPGAAPEGADAGEKSAPQQDVDQIDSAALGETVQNKDPEEAGTATRSEE